MKKPKTGGNMLSRQAKLRRFIYYLFIFTIILYIFSKVYRYYDENYSNSHDSKPIPPYNKYIDQEGNFLPYSSYKILQLVAPTFSPKLNELYTYLIQKNELKLYFKFVPMSSYHITLTDLKNNTSYDEKQLKILIQEQEILDKDHSLITCLGRQLLIINKSEIRLEVDLPDFFNTDYLTEIRKRWNQTFPTLIIRHYTSYYITLAYQYKDIPTQDIYDQLDKILKEWQDFPIEIELDPIEISSYSDLSTYTPILPDVVLRKEA